MGKLKETNGCVRFTLDKLCGIRADLLRTDVNWQNWGFNELIEAMCNGLTETLLRDLKDQTDHSRNNTEESISCRPIKTQKQENASITQVKITKQ